MRNTLLAFGIAACLATPFAIAQGQSGQAQGNAGQGTGVTGSGQVDPTKVGGTQDPIDHNELGRDTADRAKMQQGATIDERTQFGQDQSDAAQTQNDDVRTDSMRTDSMRTDSMQDEDTVPPVGDNAHDADDDGIPDDNDASTFGQDTAARAKLQKDADPEDRTQFGDEQSDAAKAKSDDTNDDDDDGSD